MTGHPVREARRSVTLNVDHVAPFTASSVITVCPPPIPHPPSPRFSALSLSETDQNPARKQRLRIERYK